MSLALLHPQADDQGLRSRIDDAGAASAAPDTHYVPFIRWIGGDIAPERSVAEMLSREVTVADIYSGELEAVSKVIQFSPSRGVCRDVTEEIAIDVATKFRTEMEQPDYFLRSWLHSVLGVSRAENMLDFAS
jgi:hypothetical protein